MLFLMQWIPFYNLIENSDYYSKTSGILWQYYRDEPDVDDNGATVDFTMTTYITDSFKIKKKKKTDKTGKDGTKNVETTVPLKYLSNLWRTLEVPLINYKINLHINWYKRCVLVATNLTNQEAISRTSYWFGELPIKM